MLTTRSRLRGERGQSLVEFALVSPLFFLTLFGAIEFGLAVWQYNMIADLAQEGARWASVRGSTAGTAATNGTVQTYVQGRALGIVPTVTTTWPDGGSPANLPGKRVQVVVTKNFVFALPIMGSGSVPLQSRAQMIIAR